MSKKVIGIDINEVLRARWIQFDKYYIQEFGDKGVPLDNSYVYDFFKYYKFEDKIIIEKELKEPEQMPDISDIYYQVDNKTGECIADDFVFKPSKRIYLSKEEVYNKFLYHDYCFEIFGAAPLYYYNINVDVNNLYNKYKDNINLVVLSVENYYTISPTLFFLSKSMIKFKNIHFVDNPLDMWKFCDILITTDPSILSYGEPWSKKLIKVVRPYNENIKVGSLCINNINDLLDNQKFEKLIKIKKNKLWK